jgi:hypothetical protein
VNLDALHDDDDFCDWCGAELPVDAYYGRRYHCSTACLKADTEFRDKIERILARRGRTCLQCGGAIPLSREGNAKYCCDACQHRAGNARKAARKPARGRCLHCGEDIPADKPLNAKFCSKSCRNAHSAGLACPDHSNRRCAECGARIPAWRSGKAKYCCDACNVRHHNRRRSTS